jgi:hypothetical protein
MTNLRTARRLRTVCCTIIAAALTACAGAHATKVHARTMRPAHGAVRSITAPRNIPAVPEVKPLVGELMV